MAFAIACVITPARAGASCIGVTVQQVASGIGNVPTGALVVASPLESDVPPSPNRGDELALRVASLVAGKIPGAHAAPRAVALEQARAVASRSALLVYVHVQIAKSQMRVTVDAYPVIRNVWDRARLPPPPPSAHAYAVAPIDAEVRAFYSTLPLELQTLRKAPHGEGEVIAAACGDLDGDGGAEILLASRERVSLGRVRGGKLDVERSVNWSVLAKRAPVPLREPLGGAEIQIGRVLVGTSDRGAVVIDDALGAPRALPGGIPIGGGWCAPIAPARLAFDGPMGACESPPVPLPVRSARESFDTAAAFSLVGPTGEETMTTATRENGKLRVRVGTAEKASFDGVGAQVALFDANLDGALEIAFSSDAQDDAITIATLEEKGPRVISRIAAPAGVRAIAACPAQNGGAGAVLAIVGNEVWIVR